MAVLSNADRIAVWTALMQDLAAAREALSGLAKADVRAAIDAADDWANTNAVSYNLALPIAARNNLTSAQKARLLQMVIQKRWITGA